MVKQTTEIINEKQKIVALTSTDPQQMQVEINQLLKTKKLKTYMIAGEGTVFLLLLLYGIYRIRKAYETETQLVAQQKNFVLSVTHELKTPIAATKLQLQTLLKHKQLEENQREQLLQSALKETNRLNRLIEDVLLASQAEKNELIINTEKINLSDLTKDTIENYYKEKISNGSLRINVEPEVNVMADKLLFPSIIINLIDNAFKYSPENPQVVFELKKEGQQAQIQVSDNGIGVDVSQKEKIFLKFYRVGNEETRKTKGTGLGLYIVKTIVQAHGGKISVSNNQLKGSVFTVSI